jgi:hypothetical protein
MVLGIIGRLILRGSYHSSMISSRRNRNAPAIMVLGLGLAIIGWIGVFFSRIVKAAVSRQREFLADASAVQFTRQTDGIANALKKIGGYSAHSYFKAADPEEISHMLFAGGTARLTSLLATHPPLAERIRALDPQFRESNYPEIDARQIRTAKETPQAAASPDRRVAGFSGEVAAGFGSGIAGSVGHPEAQHVDFARQLQQSIPQFLYDAAHSADGALLLTIALSLGASQSETQLRLVEDQLGAARTALVRRYYQEMLAVGPAYRLPLLEIAFPTLKQRPGAQLEFLLTLIRRLIEIDGRVSLSEYCFYRVVASHLSQAADPVAARKGNRVARKAARQAAVDLVRIVAREGNSSDEAMEHAFAAGIAGFGQWADGHVAPGPEPEATIATLDRSLETLRQINSAGQQSLLRAISETITHDGRLTLAEAELLRAICASLDCPLPPLLAAKTVAD